MKNKSIKTQITILLTMLMASLAVLLLVFMLFISRQVALQTARRQLVDTVRANLTFVEITDKKPIISSGFSYSHNGIFTLVYSQNESLIAGQIPVSFQLEVPFENGTIRMVESNDSNYLVLDFFLSADWEHGVWVRGLTEAPDNRMMTLNLLMVSLVSLPVFLLLAVWGSFHITRRVFRPLDHITATAEAINEAKDLSGRIGLPEGTDEFSRLASDFDKMFERLERSFETEKQFTADASHELRTPVAVIKGACEYSEKYDETPNEYQETLAMIHRQADKMSVLISQLLSMTRMEQEIEYNKMTCLDLGKFTKQFIKEQQWDHSRIDISVFENILINGNQELLSRLITNLIENGFKYNTEDGRLWISVTAEGEEALLSVKDNGIGISESEQNKIWQRFYQVDGSRSEEHGSGLGLAMVEQIAKLHGGYMTVESIPEKGSTFTLHLPLIK